MNEDSEFPLNPGPHTDEGLIAEFARWLTWVEAKRSALREATEVTPP